MNSVIANNRPSQVDEAVFWLLSGAVALALHLLAVALLAPLVRVPVPPEPRETEFVIETIPLTAGGPAALPQVARQAPVASGSERIAATAPTPTTQSLQPETTQSALPSDRARLSPETPAPAALPAAPEHLPEVSAETVAPAETTRERASVPPDTPGPSAMPSTPAQETPMRLSAVAPESARPAPSGTVASVQQAEQADRPAPSVSVVERGQVVARDAAQESALPQAVSTTRAALVSPSRQSPQASGPAAPVRASEPSRQDAQPGPARVQPVTATSQVQAVIQASPAAPTASAEAVGAETSADATPAEPADLPAQGQEAQPEQLAALPVQPPREAPAREAEPESAPDPEPVPQALPEPDPDTAPEDSAEPGDTQDPGGLAAPAPSAEIPATAIELYAAVLDHLRALPSEPCFTALPALAEDDTLRLEVFGPTDVRLDDFRRALEARTGLIPGMVQRAIAPPQCRTLEFIRNAADYPAFSIYFDLDARVIDSGNRLVGRVHNTRNRALHLLLIDNEGRVQRLDGFLGFSRGTARFEVPMTLQGDAVETWQLLLAVALPVPMNTVRDIDGVTPAAEFFANLDAEMSRVGHVPDLSLIAFSVR